MYKAKPTKKYYRYRLIMSFTCRGVQIWDATLGFAATFSGLKNRTFIGNIAFCPDLSVSPTYAHVDHE